MNKAVTLCCLLLSLHSFSQCDTKPLDKREYETFKYVKEKNVGIRVTLLMNNKLLENVETSAVEMKSHLKDWAARKVYPDLSKYIIQFKDLKKSFEKGKQIKELQPLEQTIYCFYNNGEILYTKLQKILLNDEGEKFDKNITNVAHEIISWQAKIDSMRLEMDRLFKLYPVL